MTGFDFNLLPFNFCIVAILCPVFYMINGGLKQEISRLKKHKSDKKFDLFRFGLLHTFLSFCIALLAWPAIRILDLIFAYAEPQNLSLWMAILGFPLIFLSAWITAKLSRVKSWIYYGLTMFQFTCMIDAIICLEFEGLRGENAGGVLRFYMDFGEPYLLHTFGYSLILFDTLGFFPMYILLAFQISSGRNWRSTGIYWTSSILTNMILILMAYFHGNLELTFCSLFNLPYMIFPAVVAYKVFTELPRKPWNSLVANSIGLFVFDIFLIFGFALCIFITFWKTQVTFGSSNWIAEYFKAHDGTSLYNFPAPYPLYQNAVYLLYCTPLQIISLFFLFRKEKPSFLWEATLIQAGTFVVGQGNHIIVALHSKTPAAFQCLPCDPIFWLINLTVVIVPHLFLYRLSFHRIEKSMKLNKE